MVDERQDRGPNIIILTCFFTSLSVTTTLIRLFVRKRNHHLSWDDLAITVAVGFTCIAWPFTILAVKNGYGKHESTLAGSQIVEVLKWLWEIEFDLFFTLPLTKISICFFILRIKNDGWLKFALYAMMIGLILTNLPPLIVLCAQCQPLQAYWDRSKGTCWNAKIYNIAIWIGVSFSIFSDLVCSGLPIVVLWNVKIKSRTKYLISGLMSLGLIATACGTVRAYVSAVNNSSKDLTYDLAIITEWAILEQHFAILGTNLALSRYVYRHFLGKDATNQSTARRSIPLSGRRKYTTITKSHSIGNGQDTSSQYNLRPMEPSVIRATTEIDIRSSFHSDPEPASFTHYNAFGDEMAPKAGRDEILLNKLA